MGGKTDRHDVQKSLNSIHYRYCRPLPMHTLYYAPGAASMVVHWLLIELDVPHRLRSVDLEAREQKRPEYLTLNPNGVVPTLVVDDEPRTEAMALTLQLADTCPDAGLAPATGTDARALYYEWSVYLSNTLQPLFRQWWYPHEPAGEDNAEAVRAHVQPRIQACWDRIDAHLSANGRYLLGDRLSALDFYLTMLMRWSREMPRPASGWQELGGLAMRMKARPSFATLCEREGLADWV